ncbi:hypothetical protein ERJ75_001009900 [Trypanosoma vivax]|uniref:Uncharacterized protein n=1 Tax=Trypanosoma vivax (strain Y486) TaxID=1055687 RepID=G0TYM6_TRYVY|nr:hypothetical protein TRVL_02908 [Trypanosoma vivax]KAH8611505.1 hypothetical protein ERJ75_001009900 [Trypanosoma vivax]CCC49073.1 conserved hypothetical protein [Trypanosoma vivax Y486]
MKGSQHASSIQHTPAGGSVGFSITPCTEGTAATTPPGSATTGSKRLREGAHLYDGDGQRLRGMKKEAACLMYSNGPFIEGEMHHVGKPFTAGRCVSLAPVISGSDSGAKGNFTSKLPALPDMFGVVPASFNDKNSTDMPAGSGPKSGSVVQASRKWSLVQRLHVTLRRSNEHGADNNSSGTGPLVQVGAAGYRWARADSLQVEAALGASMGAMYEETSSSDVVQKSEKKVEMGDASGSWLSQLLMAVPPEVNLSVIDSHFTIEPFAFVTVSASEYVTLDLDDDRYQPRFTPKSDADTVVVAWRFGYEETVKLFNLYERFGNFVVMADRWALSDARGCAVAKKDTTAAGSSPSVEAMMERYKLVTEAVLDHRLHLLRRCLSCPGVVHGDVVNEKLGTEGGYRTPTHKSTQQNEGCISTSTHPLVSLMEKHPIMVARENRIAWLASSYKMAEEREGVSSSAEVKLRRQKPGHKKEDALPPHSSEDRSESFMLEWYRKEFLGRTLGICSPSIFKSDPATVSPAPPMLHQSALTPPQFWYDGLLEHMRRGRLAEDLESESRENVPYFKATAALLQLERQAELLFEKLRTLTRKVEPQSSTEVGGATAVRREGRSRRVARAYNHKRLQQQAIEPGCDDNYYLVLEDVRRVPLVCERLRLCVQAGLFLPPRMPASNANARGNRGITNEDKDSNLNGPGRSASGTHNAGTIVNRALSNSSEVLLLSLPSSAPRIHLSVEQELEKHLWEDHRALCDDSADVQEILGEVRSLYTQNVILRRFAARCSVLKASIKKLANDVALRDV